MAAAGRTLAQAFVELRPDNKKLGPELKSQTETAGANAGSNAGHHFGESMKKAIKAAGIALALGGALIAVKGIQFLKQANADASDLNETVSKAQNIYPKTTAALERFASTSATALGLSRQQALEGAASFGNFFNQIGIGEKTSLKMSTALIKLSADLGSFNNADPAEVMDSFLSATRGEYDSLQKFIPTINAATVQTEALRLSHKKSVKDLTDADKAQALYSIALRDAGKAQGDFARTSEGQANQIRIWQANLSDIRSTIGTAVMPVVTTFYQLLNSRLAPAIKELWAKHGPALVGALQTLATGVSAMIAAFQEGDVTSTGFVGVMERIGVAARNIGPILSTVVGKIKDFFASQGSGGGPDLGAQFTSIGDSAKKLVPVVKEFIDQLPSLNDLVNVGATVLGFLADHTDELRDAMPLLVGAVIAYKVAQLASNVAVAASPLFKVLDYLATKRQTAAIRENTAAQAVNKAATITSAAATTGETAAQNAGFLTRARATAGMIAQRVAMVAVRAATIAWTAVQWLLNTALTANPIGIIIVAIAAFVAGIIYAYTHVEWFRKFVDGAFKGAKIIIEAVVGWIVGTAWPWLQRAWDGIIAGVQWVQRFVRGAFLGVQIIVNTVIGWIVGFIQSRINAAIAIFHGIGRIVSIVRDAFTRTNAAIAEKIAIAVAWVKALPGRFVAGLAGIGHALYEKGKDLIQGFIDGIKNMAGRVADALISLLPGPLKKFAGMLGLASPSKLFRQYGVWTVQGYVQGLRAEADAVGAAITRLVPGIPPGVAFGFAGAAGVGEAGRPRGGEPPMRLHPRDIAELGKVIGQVMAAGIGAANQVHGRRANLLARGGG